MKTLRGGSGLGDAVYAQAVARHLVRKGERIAVRTSWPDVFKPLGDAVRIEPFSRLPVAYLAHYSMRKRFTETDQFEDVCIQAGIREPVELRLDWKPTNHALIDGLRKPGKPIVCVQLPRSPMGRTDGFGGELLPNCAVIQRMIDSLKGRALIVQIGSGRPLFNFTGVDIDLANKTTVADLIDVASAADGFLGYVSFIVPLAESLGKPAMLVWSSRGLASQVTFIKTVTPSKVLHKPSSLHVVDNWPQAKIDEAMHEFL